MTAYTVRAAHRDHRASEDAIYETMGRITAPLERSWQRIENARRIVIKLNMLWPPSQHHRWARLSGKTRVGWRGPVGNVLVAGDHVVSTDACGTWLMATIRPGTDRRHRTDVTAVP